VKTYPVQTQRLWGEVLILGLQKAHENHTSNVEAHGKENWLRMEQLTPMNSWTWQARVSPPRSHSGAMLGPVERVLTGFDQSSQW